MFNENASNHRGVWHIIEGELNIKTVPAETRETERKAWNYHAPSCNGRERYSSSDSKYTYLGCDCYLDSTNTAEEAGKYRVIEHFPDYNIVERQSVLCHQTVIYSGSRPDLTGGFSYSSRPKDGDVLEYWLKAKKPHVWEGDEPPGPTCSRCIRRAELNSGSQ